MTRETMLKHNHGDRLVPVRDCNTMTRCLGCHAWYYPLTREERAKLEAEIRASAGGSEVQDRVRHQGDIRDV